MIVVANMQLNSASTFSPFLVCHIGQSNGPYGASIWSVSESKTARFVGPNDGCCKWLDARRLATT